MKTKIISIGIVILFFLVSLNAVGTDSDVEIENDCGCSSDNFDFEDYGHDPIECDCGCSDVLEYEEYRCGLVEPDNWREIGVFEDIQPTGYLPPTWDWRSQGGCNEIGIRHQGNCGSCWAFATVAPLEYNIKIKDGVTVDLSEQWLVNCNTYGYSCGGGWFVHSHHYDTPGKPPHKGIGAVYESDCPYTGKDDTCGGPYPHPYVLDGWAYVGSGSGVPSVDAIKQAIYTYGPVSVAVRADAAFKDYNGGLFETNEGGNVNHAVTLVGWNDNYQGQGVWILRNSWGTGWGDNGYMYIKYGTSQVGYAACFVIYQGNGVGYLSKKLYGQNYYEKGGDVKNYNAVGMPGGSQYAVRLSESGWPNAQEGWTRYEFNVGDKSDLINIIQIGVEIADKSSWGNGPHIYAFKWTSNSWGDPIVKNLNMPKNVLNWYWYVLPTGDYVKSDGTVRIWIYAEPDDDIILDEVGVRYKLKPKSNLDASCSPNPLTWTEVKPGDTKTGTITVTNVGETGSLLNWKVVSGYPNWITCSKTSGNNLPKGSTDTITLTIQASSQDQDTRTGKIRLENSDDSTDFKEFSVSITTKKSLSWRFFLDFSNLLNRFPFFKDFSSNFLINFR